MVNEHGSLVGQQGRMGGRRVWAVL